MRLASRHWPRAQRKPNGFTTLYLQSIAKPRRDPSSSSGADRLIPITLGPVSAMTSSSGNFLEDPNAQ